MFNFKFAIAPILVFGLSCGLASATTETLVEGSMVKGSAEANSVKSASPAARTRYGKSNMLVSVQSAKRPEQRARGSRSNPELASTSMPAAAPLKAPKMASSASRSRYPDKQLVVDGTRVAELKR